MAYSLLYYPNFEPDLKWLRSVLLLVDEIYRIIPEETQHRDSPKMQEMVEWMPDSIKTVAPSHDDKNIDHLNLNRLEKAFARIRDANGGKPKKEFTFNFHPNGSVSLKGNVWLSNSKLNEQVLELMCRYNLADNPISPITGQGIFGDFIPANPDASNLIVSQIADRVAKRIGLDTITDLEIPHALNSLDALLPDVGVCARESEGLLAATIAKITIPAQVDQLPIGDYQALRESFQEIRAPFRELIASLSALNGLTRQQSAGAIERRLEIAVSEYARALNKYRQSRFARAFDSWAPVCLIALLAIIKPVFSPEVQAFLTSGVFGIEIIRRQIEQNNPEQTHAKTYRLLCKLQDRISCHQTVNPLV